MGRDLSFGALGLKPHADHVVPILERGRRGVQVSGKGAVAGWAGIAVVEVVDDLFGAHAGAHHLLPVLEAAANDGERAGVDVDGEGAQRVFLRIDRRVDPVVLEVPDGSVDRGPHRRARTPQRVVAAPRGRGGVGVAGRAAVHQADHPELGRVLQGGLARDVRVGRTGDAVAVGDAARGVAHRAFLALGAGSGPSFDVVRRARRDGLDLHLLRFLLRGRIEVVLDEVALIVALRVELLGARDPVGRHQEAAADDERR